MKKLLASTALSLFLLTGHSHAASVAAITAYQAQPTDILASKFIGMRVYATEKDVAPDASVKAGSEKEWDDIGEINDVILSRKGDVQAVIVGVGGFIGIGEKNVAVAMKDIKFVQNGDSKDDYFLGRSMDVFITKLRKYFKADPDVNLETIHGVGFRFNTPQA